MIPHYDVIVLGAGGVGSAASFHAAQRGARTLAIDRFPPVHDRGSSHGRTRIIRKAYFEHPDYVPLLERAYELWHELEVRTGRSLFFPVGLLQIGPAQGCVVSGVLESAERFGLTIDRLSPREAERQFPGMSVPENMTAVFEPGAGYLLVEECVEAHLRAAAGCGAEFLHDTIVRSWQREGDSYRVRTDRGDFLCGALIVSPGAWAGSVLGECGAALEVRRKHVYWFAQHGPEYRAAAGMPTFLYELPHGVFYGFPSIDDLGLKCAEHSGGDTVLDPTNDSRSDDRLANSRVCEFLRAWLPGVSPLASRHETCFYTMSADEHFIVDRIPASPRTAFAAGLSGHGFKFTAVLGEILAELALDNRLRREADFLTLDRFQRS